MITDEMVEVARAAYHDARSSGIPRQGSESLMRAALEAVAPAIRAAALEEAAGVVDFMAAETRKAIDKLRPITEGPRRGGKSAMLALQAQLEACENRAAAIRALKDTP